MICRSSVIGTTFLLATFSWGHAGSPAALELRGSLALALHTAQPPQTTTGTGGAPEEDWRTLVVRGDERFKQADIEGALQAYDRAVELEPRVLPQLWQRGIALYYAERWSDCLAQFEAHRTVNPNDVENAAWHFLCAARRNGVKEARQALLPVGADSRAPMPEIYELYAGRTSERAVLEVAAGSGTGQRYALFYAHLYLGLLAEVEGAPERAQQHLIRADDSRFPHFMGDVARVHLELRRR
jgi:lipoprotein NlpI